MNIGFIRTIGRDLTLLAWRDSDLSNNRILNQLGARAIPSGLQAFDQLLAPFIFNLFLALAYFNSSAADASWKLRKYIMQLSAWPPESQMPKRYPAPATLSCSSRLITTRFLPLRSSRKDDSLRCTRHPAEGRELMGRGSQGLHANVLLDTVYEPLPTWSLVMLCAATFVCPDSRMKLLARLLQRRKVYDYEQLTIMMSSIAYNDRALDFRCRPLWSALQSYRGRRDEDELRLAYFGESPQDYRSPTRQSKP